MNTKTNTSTSVMKMPSHSMKVFYNRVLKEANEQKPITYSLKSTILWEKSNALSKCSIGWCWSIQKALIIKKPNFDAAKYYSATETSIRLPMPTIKYCHAEIISAFTSKRSTSTAGACLSSANIIKPGTPFSNY